MFQADTGLTGSVVGSLYGNGARSAVAPPRTYIPEGPSTISQAAYGGGQGDGTNRAGMHGLLGGIVAFALLVGIWVTLPR